MADRPIMIASRRSPLAVAQARLVAAQIEQMRPGVDVRIETLSTRGDDMVGVPIPQVGGKGIFTAELERALLDGHVDLAVHSAKDMPIESAAGLEILAVPERGDVCDALICWKARSLDELPQHAVVGTSSPRRVAQLRMLRPDLRCTPLRGNVQTRLERIQRGQFDATVLAMAGLERLGMTDRVSSVLELGQMLPAPGQGALAVQGRADRRDLRELLAGVNHEPTALELTCERQVLAGLHGGCQAPIAVLASVAGDELTCRALVALPDGSRYARAVQGASAGELDRLIARVLADLRKQGADEIIAEARGA
jgi:hydroxymethylbilane synthase